MKMDQYCKEIKDSLDDNNNNEQKQPVGIVRLWEETLEQKKIGPQGKNAILEAKLTAKYQGLKFYGIDSEDNKLLTILEGTCKEQVLCLWNYAGVQS